MNDWDSIYGETANQMTSGAAPAWLGIVLVILLGIGIIGIFADERISAAAFFVIAAFLYPIFGLGDATFLSGGKVAVVLLFAAAWVITRSRVLTRTDIDDFLFVDGPLIMLGLLALSGRNFDLGTSPGWYALFLFWVSFADIVQKQAADRPGLRWMFYIPGWLILMFAP